MAYRRLQVSTSVIYVAQMLFSTDPREFLWSAALAWQSADFELQIPISEAGKSWSRSIRKFAQARSSRDRWDVASFHVSSRFRGSVVKFTSTSERWTPIPHSSEVQVRARSCLVTRVRVSRAFHVHSDGSSWQDSKLIVPPSPFGSFCFRLWPDEQR